MLGRVAGDLALELDRGDVGERAYVRGGLFTGVDALAHERCPARVPRAGGVSSDFVAGKGDRIGFEEDSNRNFDFCQTRTVIIRIVWVLWRLLQMRWVLLLRK